MKLPNGDRDKIPMERLVGYCLNPNHSKGKDKARVFQSVLGITAANPDRLYTLIQKALEGEVVQQSITAFGQMLKVDWTIPETDDV